MDTNVFPVLYAHRAVASAPSAPHHPAETIPGATNERRMVPGRASMKRRHLPELGSLLASISPPKRRP